MSESLFLVRYRSSAAGQMAISCLFVSWLKNDQPLSSAVYIGYYEGWNPERPCDVVLPENINVKPWTHLYYSFAGIDPSDFTITTTHDTGADYWEKFTALKQKKSTLKTYISVGGWDLGGKVFSDMVRFPGSRRAFIDSAIAMMNKYGFDGIDIDWEYPAAEDRGGAARDTANLVTFLSELRDALGSRFGLTCTLPSSYWYLKGFDIVGMAEYVDYFAMMAYDIHGTWDEISAGLDLLWRNNIDPAKVLLGLGFYGRSFTLEDSSCNTPGCAFSTTSGSGGARAGECTGTSGILSDYEISRIIDDYSVNVHYDEAAGVNWMTWSGDQWVSFDNGRTLKQKADFANSKCLGGLFSWALDLGGPGPLANPNDLSYDDTSMEGANAGGGSDGTGLFYVGQEIFDEGQNTVTAVAPVSVIFPKSVLGSPTTIDFGAGYPTSLEVAASTTATVVRGTVTSVTTAVTRYIVETTIPLKQLVTGTINYYNWNITGGIKSTKMPLVPSIEIPPAIVTDNPNPMKETGVYHTPLVTRTTRWILSHLPLKNAQDLGVLTENVTITACALKKAVKEMIVKIGSASATTALPRAAQGMIVPTVIARVATVRTTVASGPIVTAVVQEDALVYSVSRGVVSGSTARRSISPALVLAAASSEDNDCEAEKADSCTDWISSTLVTPASTYSTTTITTRCDTITACSAKATTTTSTVDEDGLIEGTITDFQWATTSDDADLISYLECGSFANLHSFCNMAKGFLTEDTLYGTNDSDADTGTCYTDGKNAEFGCGVFVEGDDCEMTGDQMEAAYDHIFQETDGGCEICGHAFFPNGCQLAVNYVSGCKTTNGVLQAHVGNSTANYTMLAV
ncbi:hypothetical protein KXX65_008120 [Aspergillus fumigatus]|nr:hypothetical protein KXX65_008120 [Aspergillus fumigatus]KAH2313687.1 hypothetical protein KXW82_008692 [Aspergillus fumigatus]KAH2869223.1 hypothetical protein KXV67_005039 [Aspergillus fumigatus]KAH2965849.1 hypothetical protein KXW00_004174 [Aspergillus fumigatus]KAH3198460.1 hypothetical protein KXX02_002665 [Aspergillus fumigatus]